MLKQKNQIEGGANNGVSHSLEVSNSEAEESGEPKLEARVRFNEDDGVPELEHTAQIHPPIGNPYRDENEPFDLDVEFVEKKPRVSLKELEVAITSMRKRNNQQSSQPSSFYNGIIDIIRRDTRQSHIS